MALPAATFPIQELFRRGTANWRPCRFSCARWEGLCSGRHQVQSAVHLNLGLRWEYDGLVYSQYGELTDVWPSLINTVPIPGSTPATGTLAGFVVPANYNLAVNPAPPVGGLFQSNHMIWTARTTTPLT